MLIPFLFLFSLRGSLLCLYSSQSCVPQEIVPLRKICRRPETDYRLLQLHAANDSTATDQKETGTDPSTANAQTVAASASETTPRQQHNSDVAMVLRLHMPMFLNLSKQCRGDIRL